VKNLKTTMQKRLFNQTGKILVFGLILGTLIISGSFLVYSSVMAADDNVNQPACQNDILDCDGNTTSCEGDAGFDWTTDGYPGSYGNSDCCGDDSSENLTTRDTDTYSSGVDGPNFSDSSSDEACCPYPQDAAWNNDGSCTYNGSCYSDGDTISVGSETSICRRPEQGSSGEPRAWYDCDDSDGYNDFCVYCGFGDQVKSGELSVGEYPDRYEYHCCGDDPNEYKRPFIEYGSPSPWGGGSFTACCRESAACVSPTGVCYSYQDVTGDKLCGTSSNWVDCDYDSTACNTCDSGNGWNTGGGNCTGELCTTNCCGDDYGEYITTTQCSGATATSLCCANSGMSISSANACTPNCDLQVPTWEDWDPTSRAWDNADASAYLYAVDNVAVDRTYYCWTESGGCDPNIEFSNGSSISQSSEGSWRLCARAWDTSNNNDTRCHDFYQIDKTDPSASLSGNGSTCEQITWTISSASDSLSGLDSSPYSFNNGSSWQGSNTYIETVSGGGSRTMNAKVRDNAGNEWGDSETVSTSGCNACPYTPNSPVPSSGASCQPTSVDLEWEGGDPDGDTVTYYVYVCETSIGSSCTPTTLDGTTTSRNYTYYSSYNKRVYWQIKAGDGTCSLIDGPTWYFDTKVCDSGDPCCESDGCSVKSNGTQPTGYTDTYSCSGETGCAGGCAVQLTDYYCNGSSTSAQSSTSGTGTTCYECQEWDGGSGCDDCSSGTSCTSDGDSCTEDVCSSGSCTNNDYCSGSDSDCGCSTCTNCDNSDGWYNDGGTYACCSGSTAYSACQDQEYRDYRCSGSSCTYSVTSTQTNYGGTSNSCNDGISCTTDTCSSGSCSNEISSGWCLIGGSACYSDGTDNPSNSCEECVAAGDQGNWTDKSNGTSCGTSSCATDACCGDGENWCNYPSTTCTRTCSSGTCGSCSTTTGVCAPSESCDQSCGATCDGASDCSATSQCSGTIYQTRSNSCTSGCDCNYGSWSNATCATSVSNCSAECDGDSDCSAGETCNTSSSACSCSQSDYTAPTVTVQGMPSSWQNSDATASVGCSDSDAGCNSSTYRLREYSSSGSCSTTYSDYTLTSPRTVSSDSYYCATAKDNIDNEGFSVTRERFRVDKIDPTVESLSVDNSSSCVGSSVTISWSVADTGGSDLNQVEVWYQLNGGGWSEIVSCRDTGVSGSSDSGSCIHSPGYGTAEYGIHVLDNATNQGSEGAPVSVSVSDTPSAPSGLYFSNVSTSALRANWTDNSSNETGFRIYRGTSSTLINTNSAGDTSYDDSGRASCTNYTYWVSSYNSCGESGKITGSQTTTGCAGPTLSANPSSANWTNSSVSVTLGVTDPDGVAEARYKWDNSSVGSGNGTSFSNGSIISSPVTNGAHTLYVWAEDSTSSETSDSFGPYQYDGNTPTVDLLSTDVGSTCSGSSVTVSWTVSDTGGSGLDQVEVWYQLNGGGWSEIVSCRDTGVSGNGPASGNCVHSPGYGTAEYGIHVLDNATNQGTEGTAATVTVDNTPSAPTGLNFTAVGDTSITVNYTDNSSNESEFRIYRGTSDTLVRTNASGDTNWTDSVLSSCTSYTYWVSAYNSCGESGKITSSQTTTGCAGPAISANPSSSTWSDSATSITLSVTDAGGVSECRYKWDNATVGTGDGTACVEGDNSISSPASNGEHTLYVWAVDGTAQENTDNFGPYQYDNTDPTITGPSATSPICSGDTTSVTWTANDLGGSGLSRQEIWRNINSAGWTGLCSDSTWQADCSGNGGIQSATSPEVVTLTTTGTTEFGVHAVDNAGNIGQEAVAASVTVNPSIGSPGNPTYSATTQTATTVSWTAATGATSYDIYRCAGSGCPRPGTPLDTSVTSPYSDNTLNANTTYRYWILASGSCGNMYSDQGGSVTTLSTDGPALGASPSSSTWSNSATNVTLTVSDGDGVSASKYLWNVDDAENSGTDFGNNDTMSSPTTDGGNTLYLWARDSVNNESNASFSPYQHDGTPPTVTTFNVEDNAGTHTAGFITEDTSLQLNFAATDAGGSSLDRVEIYKQTDSGGWALATTDNSASGNSYSSSWIDNVACGHVYEYGIHVVDTAGNCVLENNADCLAAGSAISATVNCAAVPDFTLDLTPNASSVDQGSNASYTIIVNASGGFNSDVDSWIVNNCPGGAGNCSVAPASCTQASYANCATLTITTASLTQGQTYTNISVDGTGNGSTKTSDAVTLTINVTGGGNAAPDTPANLKQYDDSGEITEQDTTTDNTPYFTFDVTDSDVGDIVGYHIQIDNSSDFASPTIDFQYIGADVTPESFTFQVPDSCPGSGYTACTAPLPDTNTYYWRVRALDDDTDYSGWADADTGFDTANEDFTVNTGGGAAITTSFTWCKTVANPNIVQFVSSASGGSEPYFYTWDFGDSGCPASSECDDIHPTHTYTPLLGSWWDTNWAKRSQLTVGASSDLTDYQIKVDVTYDTDMESNFDDIRFIDSDDSTELIYWLEEFDSGASATFWVKVPALTTGNNTLYMYYDNASAPSNSDGDAAFTYYSGFEDPTELTAEWGNSSGSGLTYEQSSARVKSGSNSYHIQDNSNFRRAHTTRIEDDPTLTSFTVSYWVNTNSIGGDDAWHADANSNVGEASYGWLTFEDDHDLIWNDGSDRDTGVDFSEDTWEHYEHKIDVVNDYIEIVKDGSVIHTDDLQNSGSGGGWYFYQFVFNTSNNIFVTADWYIDDFAVRKYVGQGQIEPTVAFGAEEDPPAASTVYDVVLNMTDNASGAGNYSETIDISGGTDCPDSYNFNSVTALGSTQLSLNWDEFPGSTSYTIYRDGSPISNPSYSCGASVCTFTDTGLSPGTEYTYYMVAEPTTTRNSTTNPSCDGALSICPLSEYTDSEVSGLGVSSNTCGVINITWNDLGVDYVYHVYKDINTVNNIGSSDEISGVNYTCDAGTCQFDDSEIIPEIVYYYKVTSETLGVETSLGSADSGSAYSYCYRPPTWEER
jgi:hypothetical protein